MRGGTPFEVTGSGQPDGLDNYLMPGNQLPGVLDLTPPHFRYKISLAVDPPGGQRVMTVNYIAEHTEYVARRDAWIVMRPQRDWDGDVVETAGESQFLPSLSRLSDALRTARGIVDPGIVEPDL